MSRRTHATMVWLISTAFIFLTTLTPVAAAADKKMKAIDFEDELVEGMNRRNLDSLSYLGEKEQDRKKQHLYRKRVGFKGETAEMIREMRFSQ